MFVLESKYNDHFLSKGMNILISFVQRYNQFIISLGLSDMLNAVLMLTSHQVCCGKIVECSTYGFE